MTGSLLIKDCSVNSLAGDSKNGSSGFLLWNDSGFSSGSLTIDHACVTARGGNLTNRLGSDSGNYGINCTYNTVTICNGSIVTASSGTVTNNESYSSGIFANDGLYILNSKVDASSYKAAIYGSVRNDVPGQGWTDVAGTQGLAQIPVSDLNGAGQNLSAYKKIHIAGSYTATVTNGTGGGTYELGDTVNITANAPTGKKLFNGWTSNAGVSFANANSASTSFVMPAQAVTVTANYVDMPAATLTQAPTAKTGLIANGSAQELINGGSATGGDLKYAIGNESAPTSNYGTAIPTGTNAGTYYVWYMVSGDSNHSDTTPAKVTVTISPKDEGDTPDDGDGQDGDTPDDGDGQDDDDTPDDGMSETEQLIRAFVARMYTQALGREAEAAGLDDWSAQLMAHTNDGAGLAFGFIMSDEFQRRGLSDEDYVVTLYHTFFDREPDEGGYNNWMNSLAGGAGRASVLAGFVNSDEFGNLCKRYGIVRGTMREDGSVVNAGIRAFVERMYLKCLGRAGEEDGIVSWTNRIANGEWQAGDVAKVGFFCSEEYQNKHTDNDTFVKDMYHAFFDREPDEGGYNNWFGKLESGADRLEIIYGFTDSEEFGNLLRSYGL